MAKQTGPMRSVTMDVLEWQVLIEMLENMDSDESLQFAAWIEREAGLL